MASHLEPVLAGTAHDPTVAAGALVAMVEGYTTDRLAAGGTAERDAAVTTLAELWFGGLNDSAPLTLPRPPAPPPRGPT